MFKLKDIKPILVTQYEELTADKMYSKIRGYIDNFSDYFSDYNEIYIPPRKYFWDILSTLNQKLVESLLIILLRREINRKSHKEAKLRYLKK